MAVTIPASDIASTTLQADITARAAVVASLTAQSNVVHARAGQVIVDQKNRELIDHLMATGKLNPTGILAACTYGV
jgi:hypothetical protein